MEAGDLQPFRQSRVFEEGSESIRPVFVLEEMDEAIGKFGHGKLPHGRTIHSKDFRFVDAIGMPRMTGALWNHLRMFADNHLG
jgi:hypothetical protein